MTVVFVSIAVRVPPRHHEDDVPELGVGQRRGVAGGARGPGRRGWGPRRRGGPAERASAGAAGRRRQHRPAAAAHPRRARAAAAAAAGKEGLSRLISC